MVFETVTGPAVGLCCHTKPKHMVLSAVTPGPSIGLSGLQTPALALKGRKDICLWQAVGTSMASNLPVNWAETNLGPCAFQSALPHAGLRSADVFSISFTAGSHTR